MDAPGPGTTEPTRDPSELDRGTAAGVTSSSAALRGPGGRFLPRAGAPTQEAPEGKATAPRGKGKRPARSHAPDIRVRKVDDKPRPDRGAASRAKREIEAQAKQTCEVLLNFMDLAVSMAFGEEARMTPQIRESIADPGARILERLTPETSEMIAKYTDPVMLALGLTAWATHIYRAIEDRKGKDDDAGGGDHPEPGPMPGGNGKTHIPLDETAEVRIGEPPKIVGGLEILTHAEQPTPLHEEEIPGGPFHEPESG